MKTLKAKFLGLDILVINHENKPYVPMKQIAENIGLDWKAQHSRIKRNEVLSEGMVIMTIPSNGGGQEAVCLPLHYLNGWLFGVKPSKVKPEIKAKLIEYQKECYEVLWDYWTLGVAKWENIRQQREVLEENEAESKKRGSEAGRALQKRKKEKCAYEEVRQRLAQMEQLDFAF
ncbi:ATPase [Rodentibacter caecimuris]|uniref:ATPase n=1 Tax=Rodentibacter caecimuris TaxID=1796644 RepID=A0A9X8YYV0_9PAST|nr:MULTISPECIES: phage antirepressor N-terminal domain-containing protein [Pasteurellaceae]AOF54422.1 Antirepressor protein ant [Pasteurellaceae bacterium NI1060]MCR1838549.1 phage antirepressor N-terminal domain-containing protein [Pasteurella caecimuris]MCU0107860.1 phage antirepressor N-terminal domain-containing protein [Pasteurella caecimuris]OOF71579.1 ATPase [Rodentibacter heylii]OOF72391.1 ATPase [Rodentibacter heylii]